MLPFQNRMWLHAVLSQVQNTEGKEFLLHAALADEPDDIYWNNIHIKWLESTTKDFTSNMVTAVTMIICGTVIIILKAFPNKHPDPALSLLPAIVISISNQIITQTI